MNKQEDLIECAARMAQELQDIIDDAKECGSDLPSTQALLDEWEALYRESQECNSHS